MGAVCLGLAMGFGWYQVYSAVYLDPARALDGQTAELTIQCLDYSDETSYGVAVDGLITVKDKPYTISRHIGTLVEKWYIEWGWTNLSRVDKNVVGGRTILSTNIYISKDIYKEDISKDISKKDEMFEIFWKTYPHYESRSKKKEAKKYRPTKDAKQLLTSGKILKRRVALGLQEAHRIKWCHLRVRDFEPQSEAIIKSQIKEIFKKHMELDWDDMRERMLKLKGDFPDVDFKKLHKERSDEKSLLNKLNFS